MKLIHLSDLHLGKRVCEFSMLDDPALYFRADLIPARFPPRGCRAAGR